MANVTVKYQLTVAVVKRWDGGLWSRESWIESMPGSQRQKTYRFLNIQGWTQRGFELATASD